VCLDGLIGFGGVEKNTDNPSKKESTVLSNKS
jgi:hypothetical protein